MIEERPIVILGSPRSGTSLTAGILNACGAWVGRCREADPHNAKGYFENLRLTQHRKTRNLTPENVARVLIEEGYSGGPWLYKCSPAGYEQWRKFDPFWILVRRDLEKTLDSRLEFGRRREGMPIDWSDRARARETIFRDNDKMNNVILENPGRCLNVFSETLLNSPIVRRQFVHTLGLTYDQEAVNDFLDESLWHHAS